MKKSMVVFLILSLISGQCFAWGSDYRQDDSNAYSSMSYARFKEQNGIKTPVQRTFWDNAATAVLTFAAKVSAAWQSTCAFAQKFTGKTPDNASVRLQEQGKIAAAVDKVQLDKNLAPKIAQDVAKVDARKDPAGASRLVGTAPAVGRDSKSVDTVQQTLRTDKALPVIGATKDLITDTAQHWKENETSSAALAKGLVDGAILDNGTTEEDCYWAYQRGAFAAQAGLEKATGIAHEFYANMFAVAGQKVGWERTGMQTLAVAGHAATFVGTVVAGTAIDLAKFGTEVNSIARNYGAAKAAFANGDYKTGLRATGQMIGGVTKELGRATVVFSAAGAMRTAVREGAEQSGKTGLRSVTNEVKVVTPEIVHPEEMAAIRSGRVADEVKALPTPPSKTLLSAPEKKISQEAEKVAVKVSDNVKLTPNGRIDYAKDIDTEIKQAFVPGTFVSHENVVLAEDLRLVQFHDGGVVGEGRSLRYWTIVSQAHAMPTMDDVMTNLALLPEWGPRTQVSVAVIPKGTTVSFVEGIAQLQVGSVIKEDVRAGGGIQYLFKDFDPRWVQETRKL